MAGHGSNGEIQSALGLYMSYGAEQAGNDIVLFPYFEVSHVTTVEDDIRVFLLRESQHWPTDIQAFNRIVSFQVSDVAASSAGDVE